MKKYDLTTVFTYNLRLIRKGNFIKKRTLSVFLAVVIMLACGGAFSVAALDYECRIGDVYYETFAEAFTSAKTGDTITVLIDVTLDGASNGQNNLFLSTNSGECNATSLTITSDKKGDERPTLKIVNGGFIVGRASTASNWRLRTDISATISFSRG